MPRFTSRFIASILSDFLNEVLLTQTLVYRVCHVVYSFQAKRIAIFVRAFLKGSTISADDAVAKAGTPFIMTRISLQHTFTGT